MSRTFSIGELVIMQRASYHFEYDGYLAMVVGGLAQHVARDMTDVKHITVRGYEVSIIGGPERNFVALPRQLRPLADKQDTENGVEREVSDVE